MRRIYPKGSFPVLHPLLFGGTLFYNCNGIACGDLRRIGLIRINMHFQCKAVVYTDFYLIKDCSALVVCFYRNNIRRPLHLLPEHLSVTYECDA